MSGCPFSSFRNINIENNETYEPDLISVRSLWVSCLQISELRSLSTPAFSTVSSLCFRTVNKSLLLLPTFFSTYSFDLFDHQNRSQLPAIAPLERDILKTSQTAWPLFYEQLVIAATSASSVVCDLHRKTKTTLVGDVKKLARSVCLAHLAALEGLPIN